MAPASVQALVAQAGQALGAGDLEAAAALADRALSQAPADPAARQIAAVAARRLGRLGPARRHFEAALAAAPRDPHILNSYANLLGDLGELAAARDHYRRALAADPAHVEARVNLASVLKRLGERLAARAELEAALGRAPGHARGWLSLGLLLLEDGEAAPAAQALDRALALAPQAVSALRARAEAAAALGEPALPYLARARALAPADRDLALAEAEILLKGADPAAARERLEALVAADPAHAPAHAALARVRWQSGDREGFLEGMEGALEGRPDSSDLWLSYFASLMKAGKPAAVLDRLDRARPALGVLADSLEAAAAAEAGLTARADAAFARVDVAADPGLTLAHLRHLLRTRRAEAAAAAALAATRRPDGVAAWPYLATAWRLLDDPRWAWLEGDASFVQSFDLDIGDLPALAERLRTLHRAQGAPLDQTLRGGTQTEGSLLTRAEPEIVDLKARITEALADYLRRLPPRDERHPLLAPPRERFRFAGSWSVRLAGEGFHVNHVHTTGWISSAFYVALPDEVGRDPADESGWLTFGEPPAELGLDLAPFRSLEPKPGRLALFPSTMWHGTRPFRAGERLTVAFDVAPLT